LGALPIDVEKTREKLRFIQVRSENCQGCLQCQMICSLSYTGRVNPAVANIRVERGYPDAYHFRVGFTAECREGCKLCTTVCPYECLIPVERKEVGENG